MIASTTHRGIRQFEGFAVYVIRSETVEVEVVPELGAKIISLKNLRTQREWLWHPKDKLELFKNTAQDEFSESPLVGIDECLPTIMACSWRGRELPDHGEAWRAPWTVDAQAWQLGVLKTSIKLERSPFVFERVLELQGDHLQFRYKLTNLAAAKECFIWAIHPLLRLREGDGLELPKSTRALLNGEAWVDAVTSAMPENECCKTFARPVREGWAAVKTTVDGDRLQFNWDPSANNTLGLWLTRGGWHGHHHFAIEPANADHDSLAVAAAVQRCGEIAGGCSATWELSLQVGL